MPTLNTGQAIEKILSDRAEKSAARTTYALVRELTLDSSFAPSSLKTGIVATVSALLLGSTATYAGSCTAAPGTRTITCSGPATPTDSSAIFGAGYYGAIAPGATGGATLTTTDGFGITVSNDDGVAIGNTGPGNIVVTDQFQSQITGARHGLRTIADGPGDITITTTGEIRGGSGGTVGGGVAGSGILVQNGSPYQPGSVSITATGDITGGSAGVNSFNYGSGQTYIRTEGNVTGLTGEGIYALDAGSSITIISQGTVTSGSSVSYGVSSPRDGIQTYSYGGGDVSITVSGDVNGAADGISVGGYGSIDATVDVSSTVTGNSGRAIDLRDVNGTADLTLREGWALAGQAETNTGDTDDTLILAGPDASSIDLSTIGAAGGANAIIGFENFRKQDAGSWTATGTQTTGGFETGSITAGSLVLDNATFLMNPAVLGAFSVSPAATLASRGSSTLSGNLSSQGTVSQTNGIAGENLTVTGDFLGGGILALDADLSSVATADVLTVNGDVSGNTSIVVSTVNAAAATSSDVLVVSVGGSTDLDDFALPGGSVSQGVSTFGLELIGSDWFLTRQSSNSSGLIYQIAPTALLSGFAELSTLRTRFGSVENRNVGEQPQVSRGATTGASADNVWLLLEGRQLDRDQTDGPAPFTTDQRSFEIKVGADLHNSYTDYGEWIFGAFLDYQEQDVQLNSAVGGGSIDSEGYGFGLTATLHNSNGSYLDAIFQLGRVESDFTTAATGALISSEGANLTQISLEVGRTFGLTKSSFLTPQAQLSWASLDGGSFVDTAGNSVDLHNNTSLIGRIGADYDYEFENNSTVFLTGNLLYDFSSDTSVSSGSLFLEDSSSGASLEIGAGGHFFVSDNSVLSVQGKYRSSIGGDDSEGASLTATFTTTW